MTYLRKEWWSREDARTVMSDKQMRAPVQVYPVDRYLVESNMNNELVNIINEDIWNPEPALRPEEEITLKNLHGMLQTTADDLKLLSGELAKYHEPGIQVKLKLAPTPLDEEFNEKVHIEEVVNAKFHGYKIIDCKKKHLVSKNVQKGLVNGLRKTIDDKQNCKTFVTTGVQVDKAVLKKHPDNHLVKSQTKVIHIKGLKEKIIKNNTSSVSYNEFSYKYVEPPNTNKLKKQLQLQELPSIEIRSELKFQQVLQIDIFPDYADNVKNTRDNNNAVILLKHELSPPKDACYQKHFTRKVSKMEICKSSVSGDDTNSDITRKQKNNNEKYVKDTGSSTTAVSYIQQVKRQQTNINQWNRNLKATYGRCSTSRASKSISKTKSKISTSQTKLVCELPLDEKSPQIEINNTEYIPYSKLTLGGVKVSDIEKELSNVPNKANLPLQPILDKIQSRENSFNIGSPKKNNKNIFSISDEDLLKEVLYIQNKVSNMLSENIENKSASGDANDTYADDFDDVKTDNSLIIIESSNSANGGDSIEENNIKSHISNTDMKINNDQKKNIVKSKTLSHKNTVDIFEYIHSVDTQESGTQSNMPHKISLKETQTSPTTNTSIVTPIQNNLEPSTESSHDLENMFQHKKEFIKKLILDEYGDLLGKTFNKPSKCCDPKIFTEPNENTVRKHTQTSPTHVKCVMTSPAKTKTRTTSPLTLSLKVDHQTSPIIVPSNTENIVQIEDQDELSISMNLSSPRFSLRLPQTSLEVVSNLRTPPYRRERRRIIKTNPLIPITSSSSVDNECSSSDLSSLGEIENNKKKLKHLQLSSTSDQSSSLASKQSSKFSSLIIPLKSEGEISLVQGRKNNRKHKSNKSEGELSIEQVL